MITTLRESAASAGKEAGASVEAEEGAVAGRERYTGVRVRAASAVETVEKLENMQVEAGAAGREASTGAAAAGASAGTEVEGVGAAARG